MDLLLIALLLAAVGAVVLVALGKVGGGMAPVQPDAAPALDGPLSRPGDLDRARFTLAVRGYRMDQVDAVLDEARDLLAARDDEIARLRRLVPGPGETVEPAEPTEPTEPDPFRPGAAKPAAAEPRDARP